MYKLNKEFIIQELGKEIVIFDSQKSMFYSFNETAGYILTCIKRSLKKEEIVLQVTKKFDVNSNEAKKDVAECIYELEKLNIITKS